MSFDIFSLAAGAGEIGICPIPGRSGDYEADLARVRRWRPGLVLTMTEQGEMERVGAGSLAADVRAAGIAWRHFPIRDFGAPDQTTPAEWAGISAQAGAILDAGGRVLVHCFGGCGRSGMAIVRLLVDRGEAPQEALARLRAVRACAVETEAQYAWAAAQG